MQGEIIMLSLLGYWMDRDKIYPKEFTPKIKSNGEVTVMLINKVVGAFTAATGIVLTQWASGWRPLGVNCLTSNAAEHSLHITAEAGDVRDTPHRDFARWICANQKLLEEWGLYFERLEWTSKRNPKTGEWENWVHLQCVPPRSGRRSFIPSASPALAARLPEQDQFNC
jgi:hypothetical protein